jgi:DivIVA domain-containing protein
VVTVLAILGVLGVLFAAAVLSTREGPLLVEVAPDAADVPLPEGLLQPEDVARLRFSLAPRGYRMREVDLALERLAAELADRDRRLGLLEAAARGAEGGATGGTDAAPTAEVRQATPADLPVPAEAAVPVVAQPVVAERVAPAPDVPGPPVHAAAAPAPAPASPPAIPAPIAPPAPASQPDPVTRPAAAPASYGEPALAATEPLAEPLPDPVPEPAAAVDPIDQPVEPLAEPPATAPPPPPAWQPTSGATSFTLPPPAERRDLPPADLGDELTRPQDEPAGDSLQHPRQP